MTTTRRRNAARSRGAILDAAEELFAERGYDAVSLQEVADAAGVSRATPSYFFGSKEALYRAVLDRVMEPAHDLVAAVRALGESGAPAETVIAQGVEGYLEFLASRPTFVRLIEWEVLRGGRFLGESVPHIAVVEQGLAAIGTELKRPRFRAVDPVQLLLSFVALSFFPLSHGPTLLASLGVDVRDPAFLEARKRHVVDLLLHGVMEPDADRKETRRPRR